MGLKILLSVLEVDMAYRGKVWKMSMHIVSFIASHIGVSLLEHQEVRLGH